MVGRLQGLALVALLIAAAGFSIYAANAFNVRALFSASPVTSAFGTVGNTTSLVGGTATSLSQIQVNSNFANLSCSSSSLCWLTTFTINGKGQAYSASVGATASGINSSYSSRTPAQQVSINYALNSEKLAISFTYSGTNLYQWNAQNLSIGYSFNNCPFGVSCTQSNQGSTYNFIAAAVGIPYQTVSQAAQGFANLCQAQGGGAVPIMLIAQTATYLGLGGYGIWMQCVRPLETNYAGVYQAGFGSLLINASVTFTNGTFTKTLYLNNAAHDSASYGPIYAQIYGYASSGTGLLTASVPTVYIITATGKTIKAQPTSIPPILNTISNQFPGSWLVSYPSIGGFTLSGVYQASNLYANINQTNGNLNNLLYPLQPTSPYYNLNVNASSGSTMGTLDVSSSPLYYPQVQMVAKVATLALYIPVAKPVIISASAPSVTSGSGTTATIVILNNATVPASVTTSVSCGTSTYQASPPSQGIGANQQASVQVYIQALYNPNLATAQQTCVATATSSSYGLFTSTKTFTIGVAPNCPTGYKFVNNTTCQPVNSQGNLTNQSNPNTKCIAGYAWNSTLSACTQIARCPTGYVLNTTVSPPICKPNSIGGSVPLWEILLAIGAPATAVVGILLYARMRKRR